MYKRQAIDKKLYYQMVELAAKKQVGVKDWLEDVIRQKIAEETEAKNGEAGDQHETA